MENMALRNFGMETRLGIGRYFSLRSDNIIHQSECIVVPSELQVLFVVVS